MSVYCPTRERYMASPEATMIAPAGEKKKTIGGTAAAGRWKDLGDKGKAYQNRRNSQSYMPWKKLVMAPMVAD